MIFVKYQWNRRIFHWFGEIVLFCHDTDSRYRYQHEDRYPYQRERYDTISVIFTITLILVKFHWNRQNRHDFCEISVKIGVFSMILVKLLCFATIPIPDTDTNMRTDTDTDTNANDTIPIRYHTPLNDTIPHFGIVSETLLMSHWKNWTYIPGTYLEHPSSLLQW